MRPLDAQSDEELLAGDGATAGECFAALYRRYETAMLAYFLRRTRSPELAADLAAETFALALASRRRYRPRRGPAAAWLFGIARHVLARSVRRGRVDDRARRRLGMAPLALDDAAIAAIEETGEPVAELLALLPDAQREAVIARVLDERDYDEIASQLRCSPAVVRQRVSRGLAVLRTEVRARRHAPTTEGTCHEPSA